MEYRETGIIQNGVTGTSHLSVVARQEGGRVIPVHLNGLAERTPNGHHFNFNDALYSTAATTALPYGRSGETSPTVVFNFEDIDEDGNIPVFYGMK